MTQLLVRNLPAALIKRLDHSALENGMSVEEECRRILMEALPAPPRKKAVESKKTVPDTFDDHLSAMPDVGEDWMFDRNDPRNAFGPVRPPIDLSDK